MWIAPEQGSRFLQATLLATTPFIRTPMSFLCVPLPDKSPEFETISYLLTSNRRQSTAPSSPSISARRRGMAGPP
jgi:hypothetical protein